MSLHPYSTVTTQAAAATGATKTSPTDEDARVPRGDTAGYGIRAKNKVPTFDYAFQQSFQYFL